MWKRDESENQERARLVALRVQEATRPPAGGPSALAAEPVQNPPKVSTVGKAVVIKGELTAGEDLTIEGHVEGRIAVKEHVLTIGSHGKIQAEVFAKSVIILGEVNGNVTATETVDIRVNGSLTGDISAPRVAIAEGAYFRGSIDMQRKNEAIAAHDLGAADPQSSGPEPQPIFP